MIPIRPCTKVEPDPRCLHFPATSAHSGNVARRQSESGTSYRTSNGGTERIYAGRTGAMKCVGLRIHVTVDTWQLSQALGFHDDPLVDTL